VSDNAHAVADPHAFKAANYNNAAAMEAERAPCPFVDGVTVGASTLPSFTTFPETSVRR